MGGHWASEPLQPIVGEAVGAKSPRAQAARTPTSSGTGGGVPLARAPCFCTPRSQRQLHEDRGQQAYARPLWLGHRRLEKQWSARPSPLKRPGARRPRLPSLFPLHRRAPALRHSPGQALLGRSRGRGACALRGRQLGSGEVERARRRAPALRHPQRQVRGEVREGARADGSARRGAARLRPRSKPSRGPPLWAFWL